MRVAFGTTADSGPLEPQAVALVRSVRRLYPDAPIVVYVPEGSVDDLSSAALSALREHATVEVGPLPHEAYPITAQLEAFRLAAEETDAETAVMLDTDILLLEEIDRLGGDAPLAARACTLRGSFWSSRIAPPVWAELYERYGLDLPTEPFSPTLGGRMQFPFYNAATVLARDDALPGQLLDRAMEVFDETRAPVVERAGTDTPLFYADQVALALLAAEVGIERLSPALNYPVPATVTVPESVRVLHYGRLANLATIRSRRVREVATDAGLTVPSPTARGVLRRAGSAAWFRTANRIPYRTQLWFRRIGRSRHSP